MSTSAKQPISVFFASPGDVEHERELFFRVIEEQKSAGADRPFRALGWELLLPTSGTRPQALINEMVDACDVFVLVMSRVWGRPATDSPIGTSYTEEEFKRAAARFNSTGSPEIVCFFKHIPLDVLADPDPQLNKVLRFRQSIEDSHQVLYRSFASADAFAKELSEYLQMYTEGKLPLQRLVRRQVLVSVPEDVGLAPDDWREAEVLTKQAVFAAQGGHMDEASVLFAAVARQTTDIRLLAVAEDFFRQRGEVVTALAIADRRLVLTRDRRRAAMEYIATAPSLPEEVAANALPHLPPESHATFLEVVDEVFGSPAFKDEMVSHLAEHMTVPELLSLARFYGGEGRSIAAKAGRYMGDAIPRAIDQVNERLRARGLE